MLVEKVTDVVVGHVDHVKNIPNADKLSLCQVDVGRRTLQIICGAPNVAKDRRWQSRSQEQFYQVVLRLKK